ncbi:hypothetical protein ACFL27_01615 [candidate division CSSED10-310 bacterium]|uniref:IPTL-CTERM sorting domain-containing protein n=1 Tax=candidate division CSSED10-310 bacterium TaxID=2855610 RepID=A0ABV6YRR3_UNCC1
MKSKSRGSIFIIIGTLLLLSMPFPVAAQMSSENYAMEQVRLSCGGEESSSANYTIHGTIGQQGPVGESASANYQMFAGFWFAQESGETPVPALHTWVVLFIVLLFSFLFRHILTKKQQKQISL